MVQFRQQYPVSRQSRILKTKSFQSNLVFLIIVFYNFQMAISKYHFLFILLLIKADNSQILFPLNYCLGNCSNCQPHDLALCKGDSPCEWGYQNSPSNEQCLISPSLQIVSSQLGQRTDNNTVKLRDGWIGNSSLSVCQYSSTTGKKDVDILGFFAQSSSLQKTFQVNASSRFFYLSFNLLRDEWLPFSDFLTISIIGQSSIVESLSISYGTRIKVQSQPTSILCSGKRVISQKIKIKIINRKQIGNQLTVNFTSSLYNSVWALTNIKLIEGCVGSFQFDSSKGVCVQRGQINLSSKTIKMGKINITKTMAINYTLSNGSKFQSRKKYSSLNSSNHNKSTNTSKIAPNENITKPISNTSNYLKVDNIAISSVESSNNIEYIPFSVQSKSGIRLSVGEISSSLTSNLVVQIDKLESSQYQIYSSSIEGHYLNLFVPINSSFIDGLLSIYSNSSNKLFLIGAVNISRFDAISPSQLSNIAGFAIFFEIFSWIGIVLIIFTILVGCGLVVEQYIIVLQILFLHVYIATNYLPLTFRDVIGGLNRILSLNFLTANTRQFIEQLLMGNVIQSGPVRFSLFSTDINFSRAFYPIIIANIIYLLWFMILLILRKLISKRYSSGQSPFLLHLINRITSNGLTFVDMVWRYQFLATIWFCFVQFYNIKYPNGSNRNQAMNSIFCIMCCVCTLIWPLVVAYYIRQSYYEISYSKFRDRFSDIYFGKMQQYCLPSIHQRMIYPLFKTLKVLLMALSIAYLGDIPTVTLPFLICINAMEVIYCQSCQIFTDNKYLLLRVVENGLLMILDFSMLMMCIFNQLSTSQQFVGLGYYLSSLALLIVINAFIRVVYIGRKKYRSIGNKEQICGDNPVSQKMVV